MQPWTQEPWMGSPKCRMLMTHTSTQMTAMTLDRKVLNSSSFCFSGVISSAVSAIASLILPMAVEAPVPMTTPRARPTVTTVPENMMHVLSCTTALADVTASTSFSTEPLSPVRMDWSTRSVLLRISATRTSAGTFPPTATSTRSPGTSSDAGRIASRPSRSTVATSASYALSSSIARSALFSVTTPTVALAARMLRMTPGSTKPSKPLSPLKKAMPKSTSAAARRIFTSRSSNCLSTSFQKGVPSSAASSFLPYTARACSTCARDSPCSASTLKRATTSDTLAR
mmetsp:Transcript_44744/g.115821  ORF Transcript_44744/g.115821 Transcript_44744/m.115821 type:complete len:285 (-) Transcript_44744:108-962(-)